MIYAYFDGDNIGDELELLLLEERVDEAVKYSESVNLALFSMRGQIQEAPGSKILLCGGDDLLACWGDEGFDTEWIESLRHDFFLICGKSVSVGIGLSASHATQNLRRAKLLGKNRIDSTVMSLN